MRRVKVMNEHTKSMALKKKKMIADAVILIGYSWASLKVRTTFFKNISVQVRRAARIIREKKEQEERRKEEEKLFLKQKQLDSMKRGRKSLIPKAELTPITQHSA